MPFEGYCLLHVVQDRVSVVASSLREATCKSLRSADLELMVLAMKQCGKAKAELEACLR